MISKNGMSGLSLTELRTINEALFRYSCRDGRSLITKNHEQLLLNRLSNEIFDREQWVRTGELPTCPACGNEGNCPDCTS